MNVYVQFTNVVDVNNDLQSYLKCDNDNRLIGLESCAQQMQCWQKKKRKKN